MVTNTRTLWKVAQPGSVEALREALTRETDIGWEVFTILPHCATFVVVLKQTVTEPDEDARPTERDTKKTRAHSHAQKPQRKKGRG